MIIGTVELELVEEEKEWEGGESGKMKWKGEEDKGRERRGMVVKGRERK